MPNKIIADSFETLGGVVQQGGKQVVSTVKKIGEDIKEQVGLKPKPAAEEQKEKQPSLKEEQTKKMEEMAKKRTAARYRQIQEEIKALAARREKELPKAVTGQPGFDEGKMVKQLEEKKEQEKKLPPLNVQRERSKIERMRGVSG